MSAIGFATYLICMLALGVGSLFSAAVALTAVFCMYGLDQLGQVSHPWMLQHSVFTNVAVGLMLLVGLLRKRTSTGQLWSVAPGMTALVCALYGYALLTLVWTPAPELAWQQWVGNGPYVLTVAMAGPLLVTGINDLRNAMRCTAIVGSAIVAVTMLFGEWGMRGLTDSSGTFETNPLAIASLAGLVMAACVFVGFSRRGLAEWILRLGAAVICLVLIIRSGSRGQLVAAVVAMALMIPIRFHIASIRGLVPALLVGAAIAIGLDMGSSLYINEDTQRWTEAGATEDVQGRLAMVTALLSKWSESSISILFGLGNSAATDPSIVGHYPHNMPLEILGEEGLVGFTLLLLILGATVKSFLHARRQVSGNADHEAVLAAAGATFIFSFLLSLKQGSLLGNNVVFMAALIVARLSAASSICYAQAPDAKLNQPAGTERLFPNLMS